MDGNVLIIIVVMCFFWNLRGCSFVKYIELEFIISRVVSLRCYRFWLGGRQYYVDIFLLIFLEFCVFINYFIVSNKSI